MAIGSRVETSPSKAFKNIRAIMQKHMKEQNVSYEDIVKVVNDKKDDR